MICIYIYYNIYYNKQLNVNLSLHDIGANYIFCLPVNTEKDHHTKKMVLLDFVRDRQVIKQWSW
jgi:hypothetical protein